LSGDPFQSELSQESQSQIAGSGMNKSFVRSNHKQQIRPRGMTGSARAKSLVGQPQKSDAWYPEYFAASRVVLIRKTETIKPSEGTTQRAGNRQ
jgi:hypothetical protein